MFSVDEIRSEHQKYMKARQQALELSLEDQARQTSESKTPPISGAASKGYQFEGARSQAGLHREGGKGKISEAKVQWGKLPIKVLTKIFDHVLEDIPIAPILNIWKRDERCWVVLKGILGRVWMCRVRFVSRRWKDAVDIHPSWPRLTTLFAQGQNLFRPQAPSGLLPIRTFHADTFGICVVCRLNRPNSLFINPLSPGRPTTTTFLGRIPTCAAHTRGYCNHCLVEHPRFRSHLPQLKANPDITDLDAGLFSLLHAAYDDIEEKGKFRTCRDICSYCRKTSIAARIPLVLADNARGGPTRGLAIDWMGTLPVREHVILGWGSCQAKAKEAIDRIWLEQHTRFQDFLCPAIQCQAHDAWARISYLKRGEVPTSRWVDRKVKLLCILEGTEVEDCDDDDTDDITSLIHTERVGLLAARASWDSELAEGWNEEEEGESVGWNEKEFFRYYEDDLDDKWTQRARQAAINDFIRNRIHFGFWITPSDEVTQLANGPPPIHIPLWQMIQDGSISHPFNFNPSGFPLVMGIRPIDAYHGRVGYISMLQLPGFAERFLPSNGLVRELDEAFEKVLRSVLLESMKEVVLYFRGILGDAAQQTAEEMSVEEVLRWLKREESWISEGLEFMGDEEDDASQESESSREVESEVEQSEEKNVDQKRLIQQGKEVIQPVSSSRSGKRKAAPDAAALDKAELIDASTIIKTHPDEPPAKRKASLSPLENDRPDVRSSSIASERNSEATKSSTEEPLAPVTPDEEVMPAGIGRTEGKGDKAADPLRLVTDGTQKGKEVGASIISETDEFDVEGEDSSSELSALTSDSVSHIPPRPTPKTNRLGLKPSNLDRPKYKYNDASEMDLPLIMSLSKIPWVPDVVAGGLGPGFTRLVRELWWEAAAPLRECGCGICARAKDRTWAVFGGR